MLELPYGIGPSDGLSDKSSYKLVRLLSAFVTPPRPELVVPPRPEFSAWRELLLKARAAPPLASLDGFKSRTFTSFFFLSVAILFISPYFCLLLVDVCRAEEDLPAARNISFWDKIIESDEFFFKTRLGHR